MHLVALEAARATEFLYLLELIHFNVCKVLVESITVVKFWSVQCNDFLLYMANVTVRQHSICEFEVDRI